MGSILILNGSPRAPRSNSRRYGEIFSACCPEKTVYANITRDNHQALCTQVGEFAHLLFVFPLYADGIPVTLLDFFTSLEKYPPKDKPTVSVLINCGFLEPGQNEIAIEMVKLFCRQNQYPFGSVLAIGSGEAILDSPFRFLAARKIKSFSQSIVRENYQTLQVTMPLTKKLFIRASTQYWVAYGKKYGTTKEQMQTMKIE